jgi:glycosyltransferase involved in cell wall biosynthesis
VHTWLYVPDGRIAWFQDAIACGLTAARRAPVHAILSSFSPATAHLVACTLSRRLGVPWIADYRDSWTADPLTPYASRIRHKVDCLLEALLLSKCAAVTAATEQLVAELRRLTADRIPVRLVRNGYDPEDFAGLRRHAQSRWTLTHVGRFYGMSRDPTPLFRALRHMLDEGRLQPGEMQVRVVGDIEPPVFELAQQFHLEELVHFTGPLAHRDALTEEISADALLFLLGDYPAAGGLLSSKIFEYLGAGRPILAIAPMASEAARLIEETRAGIVAPPNSGEKIEQALRQLMTGTCTSSLVGLREKYQRREATRELAKLLAELTS